MIASFKDREAAAIFERRNSRTFGQLSRVIYRKLVQLESAVTLEGLKSPPGNRLELLRGDRAGQHSIRINGQFRICFEWRDGHAYEIEITDYH